MTGPYLIALGEDAGAAALLGEQTDLLTTDPWRNDRYRLLSHAARFNCPMVVALLEDHLPPPDPSPNQKCPWPSGAHALYQAAVAGNLEIVRMLLDRGVPVDCHQWVGGSNTPLRGAVWHGHLDVASLLVDRGADVDIGFRPSLATDTPIFQAAQQGDMAMVEMLLKAGARVDIHDSNGRTPLDCAAHAGHVAIAKVLLDHGAFPSQLSYPEGGRTLQQAGLSRQGIKELTKRPPPP